MLLLKLTKNANNGSIFFKLPPNPYQYKGKTKREVSRKNINLELDISDLVDWYVYFDFADDSFNAIIDLVKEEDVIIDIGANIGMVSLLCAQRAGTNGKVFSFEPDLYNRKKFLRNLSLNKNLNIDIIPKAVGEKKGKVEMKVLSENNRGRNHVVTSLEKNAIDLITLDEFVFSKSLKKIDLIKIDVEGYEMDVLAGAHKTLITYFPVLVIEVDEEHLVKYGTSAAKLTNYLENIGYNLSEAVTNKKVTSKDDFKDCHFDLVATKLKHTISFNGR